MEYKLTPDDLELYKEYSIQTYSNHYNKIIKDETYTFCHKYKLPGIENICMYKFTNNIGCMLHLFYDNNSFKFASEWYKNTPKNKIIEEYIISELTNEYVLK